jgi:DNA-binding CsgD family transcriptional regulator
MTALNATLLQRTLDTIETLAALDKPQDMLDVAAGVYGEFGFTAFVLSRLPRRTKNVAPYILLNAWPQDWSAHYLEANHYEHDPLRRHCMASELPFSWREIPLPLLQDQRARHVMRDAGAFGFREGLCVPLHTATGVGGLSLAGTRVEDAPGMRPMVHLLSFYICAAVERVSGSAAKRARLTPREHDVLSWVAVGKSAPEIADILHISEFTVGDHLKNVRAKLGTRNNAHSVAVALQSGQLKL